MNIKDFCKWLGVSEKIAKLVIWLFIGMCFLIVTNIMLESIGLPYYKITVDNLSRLDYGVLMSLFFSSLVTLLNFYSVVLLVFNVKQITKIFKYAIIYLLLNIVIVNIFNGSLEALLLQIFILIYILIFCYLYSNKNKKYLFYRICSYIVNVFVQFICYLYKLRFVDYSKLNPVNWFLTSIDFLIIMFVIIFIKEIILKKKEVK